MNPLWNISQGYSSKEYGIIINAFDSNNNSKIEKNICSAFHYTSFENCIKMLKPPESCDYLELYASHFNYMNDTKEFFQGLNFIIKTLNSKCSFKNDIIKKTIGDFKDIFGDINNIPYYAIPPHYIVSFNTECNNLAQWKYYGKNCGVAIEYDLNNCIFSNYSLSDQYVPHDSYLVNYEKAQQQAEIETILNNLDELDNSDTELNKEIHCKNILLKACAAASFMKDENYKDEKEVRLLFAPYYQDDSQYTSIENKIKLIKKVEYRPRNNEYIIPYLKIRLKSKFDDQYPVKSLTVGPGQNQNLIFNSLVMFVQSNFNKTQSNLKQHNEEKGCLCVEINGIKIRKSLIPFRG